VRDEILKTPKFTPQPSCLSHPGPTTDLALKRNMVGFTSIAAKLDKQVKMITKMVV
jgi:hypothetical protein